MISEFRSQKQHELPPGSQQSWLPNHRANKLAQNKSLVKQWSVLSYICATAFQTRPPLDLEAYEGFVGKAWEEPIDNVFDAIVKRRAGRGSISPEDQSIYEELCRRHPELLISQLSLFHAGHRWGLKSGMKAVQKQASLPPLSNDFPLQTLLEHLPETASKPGPHNRKAHYLTTNFTDFDIHQIIGHIEQQPGSPSYLAYHSKLCELCGTDQPTAKDKSTALNDAKLHPRDFLPSEFIGTEVDEWFQGSRGARS